MIRSCLYGSIINLWFRVCLAVVFFFTGKSSPRLLQSLVHKNTIDLCTRMPLISFAHGKCCLGNKSSPPGLFVRLYLPTAPTPSSATATSTHAHCPHQRRCGVRGLPPRTGASTSGQWPTTTRRRCSREPWLTEHETSMCS